MKCQAGGDDMFTVTKILRSDQCKVESWILGELTKYVGHVKEFKSVILEDVVDSGVVDEMRFCRKQVIVFSERSRIAVRTLPTVPLGEIHTMSTIPQSVREQQTMFDQVVAELYRFNHDYDGYDQIVSALLASAIRRTPKAKHFRTIYTYCGDCTDVKLVEARYCTEHSIRDSYLVPVIVHDGNLYYSSVADSINYLLARGLLKVQQSRVNGDLVKVVCRPNEATEIRRRCV